MSCTGAITGEATPGETGDDDDAPPLPGQPDAGTPPLPGQPDAAPVEPPPDPLAAGIHIQEVAVFQSVAVPVARNGMALDARSAPVVEGRDSLFAITFEVDAGFAARSIEARVEIDGVVYKNSQQVSASSGAAPTAALRVKVPGSAIKTSSQFAVSLHEVAGAPATGASDGARYPAQGSAALGALSVNGPLHLVLVPFRYNADGSGRLPPLDDASVAAHRDAFQAMYPVAAVEVSVHAPVDTDITIQSDDSWGQWLDALDAVRQADAPARNVYYYGVSAPASSFGAFCNGGCIVGLGHVPGANNAFLFGAVGVSFSGNLLSDTALHEIGHTMGRQHVDCGGATGIDPNFPYDGGSTGVWGYDAIEDKLKDPATATDIMGYCNKQWISDYEYNAIFKRLTSVNSSSFTVIGAPQRYRIGIVDAAGNVEWRRFTTLSTPPTGALQHISLRDASGAELGSADGHFFPYDHMPGGTLYVPIDGPLEAAALAPRGLTIAP